MRERTCHYCGKGENFPADPKSELRPYGPGGADVCYGCATATPEREQQAKGNFMVQLEANEILGDGITVLTNRGPEPNVKENW